jgi:N-acyl-D-aspartate/D-glutamate deacylase
MRADINVIDYDRLALQMPRIVHDLPKGSPRMLQGSTGHLATLVSSVVTRQKMQRQTHDQAAWCGQKLPRIDTMAYRRSHPVIA